MLLISKSSAAKAYQTYLWLKLLLLVHYTNAIGTYIATVYIQIFEGCDFQLVIRKIFIFKILLAKP